MLLKVFPYVYKLYTTVKIEVQHLRRFPVHGA